MLITRKKEKEEKVTWQDYSIKQNTKHASIIWNKLHVYKTRGSLHMKYNYREILNIRQKEKKSQNSGKWTANDYK